MQSLEGKAVKNAPQALTDYELCKTFGCLPSQLAQEDNKVIEEMLAVVNAINEFEQKGSKKSKREATKKKVGNEGVPRR